MSNSPTLWGWTLGIGGEWALDDRWSVGAEHRHLDFGSHAYQIGTVTPTGGGGPTTALVSNVSLTADQVTVRMNWRFR